MKAYFEYSGFSDYWQGNGERWDPNKGCLFTYYGPETTYEDIIQGWIEDWRSGSDFDGKELHAEPSDEEVEKALRAIFVPEIDWNERIPECEYLDDVTEEEWQCMESPIYVCLLDLENPVAQS